MLSLTATQLPRFMTCNGSQLMGGISPVNNDTSIADEGNAADWLIAQVFQGKFKAEELINRKTPNGIFVTADMIDDCQEYLNGIIGRGDIEIDTSYAGLNYEVRGRADNINFGTDLYISDFKYGWKIVEPKLNWTLMSHAFGWLKKNPVCKPVNIIFSIYQPRPYHPYGTVRSWSISYEALMEFWKQLEYALVNPSTELKSSEHCYKCPSLSQCPANQIASMNSIDVAERAFDSEVTNKELSYVLGEIKRAKTVLEQAENAYSDLAMHRLKKGEVIPEYSLQSSIGNSEWKEGLTAEIVQAITGIDVSRKQLITPNQAKKNGVMQEVIDSFCERKNKGFKLVQVNGSKKAEQLFKRSK